MVKGKGFMVEGRGLGFMIGLGLKLYGLGLRVYCLVFMV
jgi:hypothetical protein